MRTFLKMGVAALTLASGAARAQAPVVLHPAGAYTQAPTGMTYPEAVDDFQRANIIRYKPDGSDESAGYNRRVPMQEIVATVYVFPSPAFSGAGFAPKALADIRGRLCTAQFQTIEREVTTAHPDATLLRDGATSLSQGSVTRDGHLASYKLNNPHFAGRENVTSRSDAYVFCFAGGKWTVEYRFDYPVDYDAGGAIANFMRDLAWTIPPETAN